MHSIQLNISDKNQSDDYIRLSEYNGIFFIYENDLYMFTNDYTDMNEHITIRFYKSGIDLVNFDLEDTDKDIIVQAVPFLNLEVIATFGIDSIK